MEDDLKTVSFFSKIVFLAAVLFLSECFFAHVPGFSFQPPPISLSVENERLKDVFDKLSALSGYEVGLRPRWYDLRVTVDIKNEPLDKALLMILGTEINHAISWKDTERKIFVFISEIPAKTVPVTAVETQSTPQKSPSPVDGEAPIKANVAEKDPQEKQPPINAEPDEKKDDSIKGTPKRWFFRVGRGR